MTLANFEPLYQKAIKTYKKRLVVLETEFTNIFLSAFVNPKATDGYWKAIQVQLDRKYAEMMVVGTNMVKDNLPKIYKAQLTALKKDTENRLKKYIEKREKTIKAISEDAASKQYMNSIISSTAKSYQSAVAAGSKEVATLFAATQQQLVTDKVISDVTAVGFALGDRKFASDELTKIFNNFANGQSMVVNGRHYKPSYYSEMVARTQFHEMQSFAAQRTAKNYGFDLIQVSSHNTTTPVCQDYEGKVYSMTGKVKGFPILDQTSPFHPNCLHNMFPQSEEALKAQGTFTGYKDFSNNKTDRPPKNKSFIPVKDRPKLSVKEERKVTKDIDKFEKMVTTRKVANAKIKNKESKSVIRRNREIKVLQGKIDTRKRTIENKGGWSKLGVAI
jgi:hypothetical protein